MSTGPLGANCDLCPLRGCKPVLGDLRPHPRAILVGEAPDEEEEKEGKPFVGRSGQELHRGLAALGVRRSEVSITNVIACRPPENKLKALRDSVAKRQKAGQNVLDPADACRPRLLAELSTAIEAGVLKVITLGGEALRALGVDGTVTALRGGPREITSSGVTARILPTLHPAFVLRARRWTRAFQADLGRAFRWFGSGLAWRDPELLYHPNADQLAAWLQREQGLVVYDVETNPGFPDQRHYDPCFDYMNYLGLASTDGRRAVGIPFLHVQDHSLAYTTLEARPLIEALRDFFGSADWTKGGWNSGYYDRMVIENHFGVTPTPAIDGIGIHKFVEPELPHRLGYAGSVYTDVPSWKEEFDAKAIRSDRDMAVYNSRDVAVTALTIPQLSKAAIERDQSRCVRFWPFVQNVCVELHRRGMYVDQEKRADWDRRLRKDARFYLSEIQKATRSDFNPNSPKQLRELLFTDWDLLPFGDPTESGDPSTNDDSLRAFLGPDYEAMTTPEQRRVIRMVRRFRAVTKLRGTYVTKLRPIGTPLTDDDLAFDEEESDGERETRLGKLAKKPGVVLPDGRVHPDYNAHGTVGWRLSSSKPNAQNVPPDIRDMIIAPEGRILIGCDEAQLELRMIAGIAKAKHYLAAFNAGEDPHAQLCVDFFGDTYRNAGKKEKKTLRRFVKEFTYASGYRAQAKTKHRVLTSSEGWVCGECGAPVDGYRDRCPDHPDSLRNDRRILYPDLTLEQVTAFSQKWLDRNPEIEQWWEREIEQFRVRNYVSEPIFGMKRDMLDLGRNATSRDMEEYASEIVNFPAQSGGSAIVHLATERCFYELEKYDAFLINQSHDSLTVEAPRDHERCADKENREFNYCPPGCNCRANKIARLLQDSMHMHGREWGLPIQFEGEAAIGYNWQEV